MSREHREWGSEMEEGWQPIIPNWIPLWATDLQSHRDLWEALWDTQLRGICPRLGSQETELAWRLA